VPLLTVIIFATMCTEGLHEVALELQSAPGIPDLGIFGSLEYIDGDMRVGALRSTLIRFPKTLRQRLENCFVSYAVNLLGNLPACKVPISCRSIPHLCIKAGTSARK